MQFDIEFSKTPDVFVSVNQYKINYGGSMAADKEENLQSEGAMMKKEVRWTVDQQKILFWKSDLSGQTIPVCILASEMTS